MLRSTAAAGTSGHWDTAMTITGVRSHNHGGRSPDGAIAGVIGAAIRTVTAVAATGAGGSDWPLRPVLFIRDLGGRRVLQPFDGSTTAMPLKRGKSKATVSANIREFHKGKTFKRTARKFGKAKANKQAVAVAYAMKRKGGRKK